MKMNHSKREFLNRDKTSRALYSDFIEYESHKKLGKEKYININADISISDCTRTITLDFNLYTYKLSKKNLRELRKDIKDKLYKLDVLINNISDFKSKYLNVVSDIEKVIVEENSNSKQKAGAVSS